MFEPGSKIQQYEILEHVGRGGMGDVYKAVDTSLDRIVAVKFISREFATDSGYRNRLVKEARNAASIESENVVRIWQLGEVETAPFIAFEFVDGPTVTQIMGSIHFDQKIDLAVQIARGLLAAHKVDVVHGDIKPDNIKVTTNGRVKILDFGLAKSMRADTVDAAGHIQGTLQYMSPEQINGGDISHSSDIFSYGVVLYELFTGHRPFAAEHAGGILYSILHEEPKLPSEINPNLPPWLDALLLRLLAKRPEARYADMAAVLDCLEHTRVSDDALIPVTEMRKVVTVIELRNLTGDTSLDYCCTGFTEDLIREISRRTDMVVSIKPPSGEQRDIAEIFKVCRSDFIVTGSLVKWQNDVKLGMSVYGSPGATLAFGEEYRGESDRLLQLLSDAAKGVSVALAEATRSPVVRVDSRPIPSSFAYDCYLRGRNYYQTNRPADLSFAAQMFHKALESEPGFALARTGLADVYAFQYMAYYDRTAERISAAINEARQALELDPKLPEAHRSLGRCYMLLGDYEKAEQLLLEAVRISPKFAGGYRTLAWLAEGRAEHGRALELARKALELAPTDLETLLLIGLIYLDTGKYTMALATLQRAIELGPDYGRAYYGIGTVYMKLGVFDLALENLVTAVELGGDPNSLIDAGYLSLVKGDVDGAIRYFNSSIEANHLPFVSLYYLGFIENRRADHDAANRYFSRAVALVDQCEGRDSGDCHAVSYKVLALAASGCDSEARAILSELAPRCENEGEILINVARAYAVLGDRENARQFVESATGAHAGPTHAEVAIDPHFEGYAFDISH